MAGRPSPSSTTRIPQEPKSLPPDDPASPLMTGPQVEEGSSGPKVQDVEEEGYVYKEVDWRRVFLKPKYIPIWILSIAIGIITILITIHHAQVVNYLKPVSMKLKSLPGGFLIPVAILIVISFPPLFGHELVALLCGVVWGLWIGFAIVAAGTFLGEIGTWFAFKYAFRKKAIKLEKTNLNYGSLARLTRDGGFWIVLVVRFSIIPSHFSTAVFSTCNVKFWFFAIATFLTLPKQIILVFFGVLFVKGSKDNTISDIVLGITFAITIVAGIYIYREMGKKKKLLLEEQAKRLAGKQSPPEAGQSVEAFWRPGGASDSEIDLRPMTSRRPTFGSREQEAYEMDDTRRPGARPQDFI